MGRHMSHFLRNCPKPSHSGWDSSLIVLVGLEFLSQMDVEFCQKHFIFIEMTVFVLFFNLLMSFITLTDFCLWSYPCISGMNPFDQGV